MMPVNHPPNPEEDSLRPASWRALNGFLTRFESWNCIWVYQLGVFFAIVPLLLSGCDAESAKWDLAKARNLYEADDLKGAIELLEKAHEKAPQNKAVKFELAQRYAENGQGELGIGVCNDYLEQHPQKIDGFRLRSDCFMHLGRFDEALADYKKSLAEYTSRSPRQLNGLAYFRGLANKEIDRAAKEIKTAVNKIEYSGSASGVKVPLTVRTLVEVGLVSRHIGQREAALKMLNQRIKQFHERIALTAEVLKTRVTGLIRFQDRPSKAKENELLELRINFQLQKESLGQMMVIRALLLEDLGQTEKADWDRWAVQELDFDFEQISSRFPSDLNCVGSLYESSMFLDTRGFVLGRQRWVTDAQEESLKNAPASAQLLFSSYAEALSDMDLAILAADFVQMGLDSQLCNSTELPPDILDQWRDDIKRKRAVLLHHRKEIHLRAGNEAAAALDQEVIDELGFKDASLF